MSDFAGVECRLRNGKASHDAPVLRCPLKNRLCTSGAKTPMAFSCEPKKSIWVTGGGSSNFTVKVLPGEPLSLRALIDRPIIVRSQAIPPQLGSREQLQSHHHLMSPTDVCVLRRFLLKVGAVH